MLKALLISILLLFNTLSWAAGDVIPDITVYKDPNCGCCSNWVAHLREHNLSVTEVKVDNIEEYKEKYGVPPHLGSCHTAVVGDYVIEGHVPAADIIKLLGDKTDIRGLTVPGMPIGSPGMEVGDRLDPYDVMAINRDGSAYKFNSYNQKQ